MAAALGNQYRAKDRQWNAAIDKALEERGKELGRMGAMVELAHKLLDKCAEGDVSALREFGDRKDGKVAQNLTLGVTPDEDDPLNIMLRKAAELQSKIRGT